MLNAEIIRGLIKSSPFSMENMANALGISERNLYYKLKNNTLTINEINMIALLLNTEITNFIEEKEGN